MACLARYLAAFQWHLGVARFGRGVANALVVVLRGTFDCESSNASLATAITATQRYVFGVAANIVVIIILVESNRRSNAVDVGDAIGSRIAVAPTTRYRWRRRRRYDHDGTTSAPETTTSDLGDAVATSRHHRPTPVARHPR